MTNLKIIIIVLFFFVGLAAANDNINTFKSNSLTNNFNGITNITNVTNTYNNYTNQINASNCSPANEAIGNWNGTDFVCISIAESDPIAMPIINGNTFNWNNTFNGTYDSFLILINSLQNNDSIQDAKFDAQNTTNNLKLNKTDTIQFSNITGVPCFNCSIPFANISGYIDDDSIYETLSNKSTDTGLGSSDDLYPTQKAVKTYIDAVNASQQINNSNQETEILSKEPLISTGSANYFWNGSKIFTQLISSYISDFTSSVQNIVTSYGYITNTTMDRKLSNFTNDQNWVSNLTMDKAYNNLTGIPTDFQNATVQNNLANWNSTYNASYDSKEPAITGSTNNVFWNGLKSWIALSTSNVTEGINLYFTSARVRSNISNGTSGNLTYNSTTGKFNFNTVVCSDGATQKLLSDGTNITCGTDQTGAGGLTNATVNFYTGNASNLTSGNLSVNRLNGGSGASSSTYLRGDMTWQTPSGGSGLPYVRLANKVVSTSTTDYDLIFNITIPAGKDANIEAYLSQNVSATALTPQNKANSTTNNTVGFCTFTTQIAATTVPNIDNIAVTTSSADTGETAGIFFPNPVMQEVDCTVQNIGATDQYLRIYTQLDAAGTLWTRNSSYYTIVTS